MLNFVNNFNVFCLNSFNLSKPMDDMDATGAGKDVANLVWFQNVGLSFDGRINLAFTGDKPSQIACKHARLFGCPTLRVLPYQLAENGWPLTDGCIC